MLAKEPLLKRNSFSSIHIKLVKILRKYHLLVSISIVNSQGFRVVISMEKNLKFLLRSPLELNWLLSYKLK